MLEEKLNLNQEEELEEGNEEVQPQDTQGNPANITTKLTNTQDLTNLTHLDVEENNEADATDTLPVEKPKMFTQEEVNSIVGKVRKEAKERAMKELMDKYGVTNDIELDDVFGRGQAYDVLNEDYNTKVGSLRDALAENALLKSGIDSERWDDVKLILGGKGLDLTEENIIGMLGSHPEWKKNIAATTNIEGKEIITPEEIENINEVKPYHQTKPGVLRKLGNEAKPIVNTESDEEKAAKLFGYKSF